MMIKSSYILKIIYILFFVLIFSYLLLETASLFYKKERQYIDFKPLPLSIEYNKDLGYIYSESLVVLEEKSGKILFAKNPDILFPPASLTKLVTLYMVYQQIHNGKITKDTIVPIPIEAWAKMLPSDASLMFLEPSQIVSIYELMLGLAIPSGNDASIAVADYLSGSVPNFVKEMNKTVKDLGFNHIHFEDANGYSATNFITAHEFAEFCKIYIQKFPEAIEEIHKVDKIIFPTKQNYPSNYKGRIRTIIQKNHNPLLNKLDGIEGLKTGYIGKSGNNIAVSVKRNGIRLIAVELGAFAGIAKVANQHRINDVTNVINYLYKTYTKYPIKSNYIWGTYSASIPNLEYIYHYNKIEKIFPTYTILNGSTVHKKDNIGYITIIDTQGNKAQFPLISNTDVSGSWGKTILSKIVHFIKVLFQ